VHLRHREIEEDREAVMAVMPLMVSVAMIVDENHFTAIPATPGATQQAAIAVFDRHDCHPVGTGDRCDPLIILATLDVDVACLTPEALRFIVTDNRVPAIPDNPAIAWLLDDHPAIRFPALSALLAEFVNVSTAARAAFAGSTSLPDRPIRAIFASMAPSSIALACPTILPHHMILLRT